MGLLGPGGSRLIVTPADRAPAPVRRGHRQSNDRPRGRRYNNFRTATTGVGPEHPAPVGQDHTNCVTARRRRLAPETEVGPSSGPAFRPVVSKVTGPPSSGADAPIVPNPRRRIRATQQQEHQQTLAAFEPGSFGGPRQTAGAPCRQAWPAGVRGGGESADGISRLIAPVRSCLGAFPSTLRNASGVRPGTTPFPLLV